MQAQACTFCRKTAGKARKEVQKCPVTKPATQKHHKSLFFGNFLVLAIFPCFYLVSLPFVGKDRETPFPWDSSLEPRWDFAPQNKITSSQLLCRCSKHMEIDILRNKRAAMAQSQFQKAKASLPTLHTCPSINVFHTGKPAESPHSAFFHLPREAKVTSLPHKLSFLWQPCAQGASKRGEQLSTVCSQRLSLMAEQSQLLS